MKDSTKFIGLSLWIGFACFYRCQEVSLDMLGKLAVIVAIGYTPKHKFWFHLKQPEEPYHQYKITRFYEVK